MTTAYPPGTVARIDACRDLAPRVAMRSTRDSLAFRNERCWTSITGLEYSDSDVSNVRPLTVLDFPVGALNGQSLIAAERLRQIEGEGWTHNHDSKHGASVLAEAGHAYRYKEFKRWPWAKSWWKPKGPLRNLIRAGALYQAAADVAYPRQGMPGTTPGKPFYERMRDDVAGEIDELLAEVTATAGEIATPRDDGDSA